MVTIDIDARAKLLVVIRKEAVALLSAEIYPIIVMKKALRRRGGRGGGGGGAKMLSECDIRDRSQH